MNYARKVAGNAIIAASLRGQKRFPFLPRERLESVRDARIRALVSHAAKHVPYYRELFQKERIHPKEIKNAADLGLLPLLPRETVRNQPRKFISDARPARNALSFLTSGSTGIPLEIWHDQRSLLANIAFGERERAPVISRCGGSFRPKELYVGYETSTFKKVMAFYEQNTLLPVRPRRRFVSLLEPIDSVVEIAREEKPDVLVGYGGWIDLFFKTLSARSIEIPLPKLVMYMGEAMPHGGTRFIEDHFGVPVMSRYNAVEAFKIGYFCEERSGFHIHEDLCHVRIIKEEGADAGPGEQGQVVITNLINRGSVLINYLIGDIAALSDGRCPCGRTFKLMSELEGRVEDILVLDGARFVHPRSVWHVFKDDREVLQYQLTQREPERFELNLATTDDQTFERAVDRAVPKLKILLGASAEIDVHRSIQVRSRPGAKFRSVQSLCGTGSVLTT